MSSIFGNAQIDCDEARRLVTEGAQLIDVRTPQEFSRGSLPGATNVPLQGIHHAQQQLHQDKPIVVFCASGKRSAQAQSALKSMGFSRIHNLGSFKKYVTC